MDYKASKNAYSQVIILVFICVLFVSSLSSKRVFADSCNPAGTSSPIGPCTATSTSAVTVTARVVDPNAPPDPGPNPPSGGGGGGGSPAGPNTPAAVITLSGRFAPNATISITLSGVPAKVISTDSNGLFAVSIPGLTQGLYSVSLVARDAVTSTFATSVSYSLYATIGVETIVSNIAFSPLLVLDKTNFRPDEKIPYSVRGVPSSSFELFVDNALSLTGRLGPAGSYADNLTSKKKLPLGKHTVTLREKLATSTLLMSSPYEFFIGDGRTVPSAPKGDGGCPKKGDFNGDCKVNIIDFSILAFWHNRLNFPKKFDLNNDGKINVKDFSILAFYWTG